MDGLSMRVFSKISLHGTLSDKGLVGRLSSVGLRIGAKGALFPHLAQNLSLSPILAPHFVQKTSLIFSLPSQEWNRRIKASL
jgi:hypothetical protein